MESRKRQRRKVLTEEEYENTMTEIIGRQYYPDVPQLERQVALQKRRAARDVVGAVAIRRAARQLDLHEETLIELEEHQESAGDIRKIARPLERETLTGFHDRVTSEDNAEFERKQNKEITRKRLLQEKEYLAITNGVPDGREEPPTPLQLASDQFNPTPHHVAHKLPRSVKNPLFHLSSGEPMQDAVGCDSLKLLKESHEGDGEDEARARMPPPKRALVEYIPKHRLEKKIEPSATRFPSTPMTMRVPIQSLEESDVSSSAEYSTEGDDMSTDLDSVPKYSLEKERRQGTRKKAADRESYVAMTPVIVPNVNASPIMTWGVVSGTPLSLEDGGHQYSDSHSSPFRLNENTRDRDAARAMEIMEHRSRKVKGKQKLGPVARRLLEQRSSSVRSSSAFGTALRSTYSSLSRSSLRRSRSSGSSSARVSTPRVTGTDLTASSTSTCGTNKTDGLLKLPN